MSPELERAMSELIQHGEMSQEVLRLLAENESLQGSLVATNEKLQAELLEVKALLVQKQSKITELIQKNRELADSAQAARRCAKNSSFGDVIARGGSAAPQWRLRSLVRGRVSVDLGVDVAQTFVTLWAKQGNSPTLVPVSAAYVQRDGSFSINCDAEGPAILRATVVGSDVADTAKPTTIHLVRGATSYPRVDLRSCGEASCTLSETIPTPAKPTTPAKPALVPTRDVQVWMDGVRRGNAPRRCLMRAFMLGTEMPTFGLVRFITADGRRLKPRDIDWTGFGLKPIIARRRVLVFRDGRTVGPLERGYVLEGFRQNGVLPEGYEFPKAIWNLTPQDVNWECT